MKKFVFLICLLALVSCTRTPAGRFGINTSDGVSDSSSIKDNTKEEISLERLEDIEDKIDEKVNALNDESTVAGNLDSLVDRDDIDPALLYDRNLRNQAMIEQKFDQKIEDNLLSESSEEDQDLDQTLEIDSDSSIDSDRDLSQQNTIDQNLDEQAAELLDDDEEESESSVNTSSAE